jgi:hypothetical protein
MPLALPHHNQAHNLADWDANVSIGLHRCADQQLVLLLELLDCGCWCWCCAERLSLLCPQLQLLWTISSTWPANPRAGLVCQ